MNTIDTFTPGQTVRVNAHGAIFDKTSLGQQGVVKRISDDGAFVYVAIGDPESDARFPFEPHEIDPVHTDVDFEVEERREVAYISSCMTGKAGHNRDRFAEVAETVRSLGYDVLNPAEIDIEDGLKNPDGSSRSWSSFMQRDLDLILNEADLVVTFDDYGNSRGATDEMYVAAVVGKPVKRLVEPPAGDAYVEDADLPIPFEAKRLVLGERRGDYGHPLDNFRQTVEMLNAFLAPKLRVRLTPVDFAYIMVLAKLSRQSNAPKRDNLVDAIGYLYTADLVMEEAAYRGEEMDLLSDKARFLRDHAVPGALGEAA